MTTLESEKSPLSNYGTPPWRWERSKEEAAAVLQAALTSARAQSREEIANGGYVSRLRIEPWYEHLKYLGRLHKAHI
jgi:hypothetical protein